MTTTPEFYDPHRVGTLFYPNSNVIAADAEAAGLRPTTEDRERVLLLIVDMQVDFCHKAGSLYVPGAEDDIRRLLGFVYSHAARISRIVCSLDSHYPIQIFHPSWWADTKGKRPEPLTVITEHDVESGRWHSVVDPDWSTEYLRKLREHAKKDLVIWPYHVPIGGVGSALDPELWSAVFWHAIARRYQPVLLSKGSIPETEHYSIVRPEVPVGDLGEGDLSTEFRRLLDEYDHLIVAGEAETHCVLETVRSMVDLCDGDRDRLTRINVLRDCMSPVIHPDIDFHKLAAEQFQEWEGNGLHFVTTRKPPVFLT